MRALQLALSSLLSVGLVALGVSEETSVAVRVNREGVYFRESLPQTKKRDDIGRHADPNATYLALDKKQGEVAGYSGNWFRLANRAHDAERGWVAAPYVEAIKPDDEGRLERLGSPPVSSSDSLQPLNNVLGILVALATLLLLIKKYLKHRRKRRLGKKAREDASGQPSKPFPRAVPGPPPSREEDTPQEPPILYGIDNGTVWVHRKHQREAKPRIRRKP